VQHHFFQLYRRQPDGIRTERRTGGEYAHPGIAAQPWRTHRRRPLLPHRLGKLPDQPDVGKILQSPERIGIPVFRRKDDPGTETVDQSTLPGNAELGGKVIFDMGNDFHAKRSFPVMSDLSSERHGS